MNIIWRSISLQKLVLEQWWKIQKCRPLFLIMLKQKKETCKYVVKKLSFLINETLKFVLDCYKSQQMCNKAVNNYPHALRFVPDCCMTQKMRDKAVNTHPSTIQSDSECYKTQEILIDVFLCLIWIFSKDTCLILIVYCLDRYKSQRTCDEAVDDSLAALRFVSDWFVTRKTIKKLLTALYADDNVLNFDEDSGDAVCSCNDMGILSTDLNNINLVDTNYDEDDH